MKSQSELISKIKEIFVNMIETEMNITMTREMDSDQEGLTNGPKGILGTDMVKATDTVKMDIEATDMQEKAQDHIQRTLNLILHQKFVIEIVAMMILW
jgi:hypothetical protein